MISFLKASYFKIGVRTIKKQYKAPTVHYIQQAEGLSKERLESLSETELTAYLKENHILETAKGYKASSKFALCEIAGEYALVPADRDSEQTDKIKIINSSFLFLWNQFRKPRTICDVILAVRKHNPDLSDKVEKDVIKFVEEGLKVGFLEKNR